MFIEFDLNTKDYAGAIVINFNKVVNFFSYEKSLRIVMQHDKEFHGSGFTFDFDDEDQAIRAYCLLKHVIKQNESPAERIDDKIGSITKLKD